MRSADSGQGTQNMMKVGGILTNVKVAKKSASCLKQFCYENLEADSCGKCPFANGTSEWGESRLCRLQSSLPPFSWELDGDDDGKQKSPVL